MSHTGNTYTLTVTGGGLSTTTTHILSTPVTNAGNVYSVCGAPISTTQINCNGWAGGGNGGSNTIALAFTMKVFVV